MNTVLFIVTAASLAGTVALAFLLIRVLREERQRSDARVALLQQLAGEQAVATGARPRPQLAAAQEHPDLDLNRFATERSGALFVTPATDSPWTSRLGIIGVMVLVLGCALAVAVFSGAQRVQDQPSQAQAPAPRALELLSLSHQQERGALRVSGTVENPRGAASLSHVTAVALLFDAGGGFVASGRAPLDFTTLAAGDESPFVISVPVDRPVARYRISFRTDDGRVVAHVDRRNGAPVARNE